MRAEFLAVGNELLSGDTVNSNAATVSRRLATAGIACTRHTVVGDDAGDIAAALREALARAQAVVVSGGLGPTEDDLTREAIAAALGRRLVRDESIVAELRERFARFGRTMPERNAVQGDVIEGAQVIPATWGTAPGMIVEERGSVVYLLPGVPGELEDMLDRAVLPDLAARSGGSTIVARTLHVAGVPESTISERLAGIWQSLPQGVSMAYLPGAGVVRVKFTTSAPGEREAAEILDPLDAAVRKILGEAVVGKDEEGLESVVAAGLLRRGWTLAAAESLTGGGFGERCTRIPGASDWFLGSLVCYATASKTELLNVPATLIDEAGVVSLPVARAMAEGARSRFSADVAIALTGVAGPAEQGRDVGTVCLAIAGPGIDETREVKIPGDRARVREVAVTSAFTLLAKAVRG